jgi:hypothetical protein
MPGKVNLTDNVVAQGIATGGVGPVWKANAVGALKNRGFTGTVIRNAAGDYTVTMDTAYALDDIHVIITPRAGALGVLPIIASVSVTGISPAIRIFLRDSANVAVDVDFGVKVELQEIAH